jgi:hypothetical protein
MLARLDVYTCWETLRWPWCPSPGVGIAVSTGAETSRKFDDVSLRDLISVLAKDGGLTRG